MPTNGKNEDVNMAELLLSIGETCSKAEDYFRRISKWADGKLRAIAVNKTPATSATPMPGQSPDFRLPKVTLPLPPSLPFYEPPTGR